MHLLYALAILCAPRAAIRPDPKPSAPSIAISRKPLMVTDYADVSLRWTRDHVEVISVARGRYPRPTTLPRYLGRFSASALRKGRALAEVQFDFPLLATAETDDATPEARKLAARVRAGVTSQATVRVPLPPGADAIAIWDSVTQKSVKAALSAAARREGAPRAP